MASKQEQEKKLHLTLLVDKEKNRVVVAEANGDFIDTLFSFLTLPLGTITRLVFHKLEQETFGCISNLYESVENLSDGVFWNKICKRMLLYPRNDAQVHCQLLKLNVDDSEPTKYFICSACPEGKGMTSTFVGASCSCGILMDKEIKLHGVCSNRDCVFVTKQTMYLIFDDLKVLQSFPGITLYQLQQLGYKNMNKLTHMSPTNIGLNEILDLLKKALTSESPLSDVFLANESFSYNCIFSSKTPLCNVPTTTKIIEDIKVTISKSKKKIVYAEARRNFVDFLFSFLTAPIGTIIEQLNGNYSIGCMNNLHKSVRELNISCFMDLPFGNPIKYPKVAPQFSFVEQPLKNLCEKDTPSYRYFNNGVVYDHSKRKHGSMKLFDPRSSYGTIEFAEGFVKWKSKYIVWDNLQVTPFHNTSSIAFLQKLNTPLDDLEEHEVSIGEKEALYLLGASLTSSEAALTEALFHLIKKPKEETN